MGMGAGSFYGNSDEQEAIATIHAALERGVNLIDTGDFYAMGKNELLVGKALAGGWRDKALLSVKFGGLRGPTAPSSATTRGRQRPKNFLAHSLSRLGVDHIDIYRPARLDPAVPIEETIGAIADMVKAGYVRYIGLSEVGVETIRRAAKVHPICDLQIEYSLVSRGPEATIFPALAELGIATTAYGVLSRGLLTGSKPTGAGDFRAHLPRFSGDNGEKNRALVAIAGPPRRRQGGQASAARHRLGPGQGGRPEGHAHPHHGRPQPHPARRRARRPRRDAHPGGGRRAGGGGARQPKSPARATPPRS